MKRHSKVVRHIFSLASCLLVLAALTSGTAHAASCDRTCLQNLLTTYIDAMAAHAPARLPVAANVRFTEDSRELKLGEGLWKTVTRKGDFRQDYIDRKRQIAASHVMLFEGDTQVLYTVVLHVAKRKIAGVETLVYRVPADASPKPDQLNKPLVGMNDPVPAGMGMSRAAMVRVALMYPEGLRRGHSSGPMCRSVLKLTAWRMAPGPPAKGASSARTAHCGRRRARCIPMFSRALPWWTSKRASSFCG